MATSSSAHQSTSGFSLSVCVRSNPIAASPLKCVQEKHAHDLSRFEIVAREDFSDVTYLLEIRHPLMAKAARPGQFVIVMLHEHGERIR